MPRNKLREAREAADLSQEELADLIGAEKNRRGKSYVGEAVAQRRSSERR